MYDLKFCKNVKSISYNFIKSKFKTKLNHLFSRHAFQNLDSTQFNVILRHVLCPPFFLGHQYHSISNVPDNIFTRFEGQKVVFLYHRLVLKFPRNACSLSRNKCASSVNQMTSVIPMFLIIQCAKLNLDEMSVSFRCCIIEILNDVIFKSCFKIRYMGKELTLKSTFQNTFLTDSVGVSLNNCLYLFNNFIRSP